MLRTAVYILSSVSVNQVEIIYPHEPFNVSNKSFAHSTVSRTIKFIDKLEKLISFSDSVTMYKILQNKIKTMGNHFIPFIPDS